MKNEDHFSIIKENIKDLMKTSHHLILPFFIKLRIRLVGGVKKWEDRK